MRIAQISDLHVRSGGTPAARETAAQLASCIAVVNAQAPDFVIASGDVTQSGLPEEYAVLRAALSALRAPYCVMPGNHDDIGAMRSIFQESAYLFECGAHASYAIELHGVRLLALDSTKHRRPGGYLDGERLDWLEAQLKRGSDAHILLAMHHPPFHAGVVPLDWMGFTNLRRLANIVRGERRIGRIVSGHVHCARAALWEGTWACTSPSINAQRLLLWERGRAPKVHVEPPGFLMHVFEPGAAASTDLYRLDGTVCEFVSRGSAAEPNSGCRRSSA